MRKFFAGHKGGFGGDQILGLRVHFRHASFAQMLAVGIVARVIHFGVAALFAKFLKRLAAHAQMIFHLRDASAARVPFLFELALADFETQFFAAQAFELLCELFTLLSQSGGLIPNRRFLLQEQGLAAIQFRALFLQTLGKSFGSGEPFMEGGEFGAGGREFVLFVVNRSAKLRELFDEPRAFGFRFGAADSGGSVLILRTLGAHSCVFRIFPEAQKLVLANGEFEAKPRQFALHVLVTMRGGEDAALGVALLRRDLFERLLCFAKIGVHLRERSLRIAHLVLKPQDLAIEGAEFALHAERAGFIGAAAGNHASLVAGTVRRDESELGIIARQRFRGRSAVGQISRAKPRKKLFCGSAKRIAEADQLVQARDHAVFDAEIDDGLVLGEAQIAKRIDEESGAAAYFIAKKGNSGASMVVGFDNDVFEFIAKILFDGGFVLFLDFRVICKDSNGVEVLPAAAFVRGEQLLDGIGGVGTVVENLRESFMARANAGEGIAKHISFLRSCLASLAEVRDARLQCGGVLRERIELAARGFPVVGRLIGLVANTDGSFE